MNTRLLFVLMVAALPASQQDEGSDEELPSTHMPSLLSNAELIEATIGETVEFPCNFDNPADFVILWQKSKTKLLFAGSLKVLRDERFDIISESSGTSLKITGVLPKDSGEYDCKISTSPPIQLIHTLNVLYPPSVKPWPREGLMTAKEGERVTLSCNATGNPVPTITWKHAGRNYDNTGTEFIISSAQKSDSGEYECIADNGVGEADTATITVEVVSTPKIYTDPSDGVVVVKEGEAVSISCEAIGDLTPVITWKGPGVGNMEGGDDKIHIPKAHRNHAGPYECTANNSIGVYTSAIIRVQVLYQPEIEVSNSWIHPGEGSKVDVTCIVRGEPIPSVMWKRGDQEIHSNQHYHLKNIGHSHTLQIHHLREEDFGRYECTASNSLGTKAETVHIIGTPQIPSFTSKPHGPPGTKYILSWMVKSHSYVDAYKLIYRKKMEEEDWITINVSSGEDSELVKTQSYELTDLEPSISYEAEVTAHNKFGWSKSSDTFVFSTKDEVGLPMQMTEEPTLSAAVVKGGISDTNEKEHNPSNDSPAFHCSAWVFLGQMTVFLIFHTVLH